MAVQNALSEKSGDIRVECFSSLKKIGIDKLRNTLNEWFTDANEPETSLNSPSTLLGENIFPFHS